MLLRRTFLGVICFWLGSGGGWRGRVGWDSEGYDVQKDLRAERRG